MRGNPKTKDNLFEVDARLFQLKRAVAHRSQSQYSLPAPTSCLSVPESVPPCQLWEGGLLEE